MKHPRARPQGRGQEKVHATMSENEKIAKADLLALTADIVASHLSHNSVPVGEVTNLIERVYRTLEAISGAAGEDSRPEPAVPIRKSVADDHIVCLEDGQKLKMLKRHLKTHHNMTPEEYRRRWNLPADYPMVAPKYAEQRRSLAKKIGLGRRKPAS